MVEGLVLPRPDLGRDRLPPFLGIVELRVDVEDDAPEREHPVLHHLAEGELGLTRFHARRYSGRGAAFQSRPAMRLDLVTEPGKVSHLTKRWEASIMKPSAFALGLFVGYAACTASADTITDWNKTAHDVMRAANVASNPASRALAMVHVAMSDAVNRVQDRYARYLPAAAAAPGASAEAAAATAARQILIQLFPNQKALVEEAHAASLKAIPDGAAKSDGVALGEMQSRPIAPATAPTFRQLPPAHDAGHLGADDAAAVCGVCPGEAMGPEERRPVPAGPAAGAVEPALRPRLQRDEDDRRHEKRRADAGADRGGAVLDPGQYRPGVADRGARALGREGSRPGRQCPALRAPQHGRRQHFRRRLGCQVHLQFLAAGDGDPQRRHGRQRRQRSRLDAAERDADASGIS